MPRKPLHLPALLACSLLVSAPMAGAQAPAPPATLNRLYSEAETAFSEKNYDTAVDKLKELLAGVGESKEAPLELLNFNLALGYLLAGKGPEAEAAFTECLKKFPKGEYASRSYLGVGRACILQGTPEKKERAIEALKMAAADPKYRSEAGLSLGQVYNDLGKTDEALNVFRSLMGSDIRSPQQTAAAVEVVGLLAETGKIEDLIRYLDRLGNQAGVRDAMAWYCNQIVVRADELVGQQAYEAALAIYRVVPPRSEIIAVQKAALEVQRRDVGILERRVAAEKDKSIGQRSNASELLNAMKPAMTLAEEAVKAIEEKSDLDAALLMRRGRCLYYLDRVEEALVCFRTIRTKFANANDAQAAAYAEIVLLNKLKDIEAIKTLSEAYLRKYPDAENAEQVATLVGEGLVQSGNWAEVGTFYQSLQSKFPKSGNLDRYAFYQGVALFQDLKYKEASELFGKFLKDYPDSQLAENGLYYVAMSAFLTNDYKHTLASIQDYQTRFPDGKFAGDMRYRLAFIDFNDKETDQSQKVIKDLTTFLDANPGDPASGSMLCLLGDTYKRLKSDKRDEMAKFSKQAIDAYSRAVWTESTDDVIQYALDNATSLLQANKDWAGIAALHGEVVRKKPESPLALVSASWVAKMKVREGKASEAAAMFVEALKPRIGDPANEQVEFLIDELVKAFVPKGKKADIDVDAIDKQLVDELGKAIAGQENATTNARLYYARARLMQMLRRPDKADLYLKGIATINAKDPSVLSPALLAVSGEILLKLGQLDDAKAMFQRLNDRYKQGGFSDAGPVGLGLVALAGKQPAEALTIFEGALANPGMSRFKEATLGKLQALVDLGKLDVAEKLALDIVSDRSFRGEAVGKAYLVLGAIYRKQAESGSADSRVEQLKKAYATYQRVYIAYKSFPETCAEAYWQAYETAKDLGDKELADNTIKALLSEQKLKDTERYKKAGTLTP